MLFFFWLVEAWSTRAYSITDDYGDDDDNDDDDEEDDHRRKKGEL